MWNSPESLIAATTSRLDLAGNLRTAWIEISESILYDSVKNKIIETFSGEMSDVFLKVGAEAAGILVSQMGVGLIRAIWAHNNILSKQLERLVREPYLTGLRTAQEAFFLPYEDDRQRAFRERRLENAINKLEEAQSLLKSPHGVSHDKFIICLTISICSSNIRGGAHHARSKARECIQIIEESLVKFRKTIDLYKRDIDAYRKSTENDLGVSVVEPGSMVDFWQKRMDENILVEKNLRDLQTVLSMIKYDTD